jgi:hypothetical protein
VSPTDKVSNLINCLTNDEDKRQNLWVHYLSGNPPSSLASYLITIDKDFTLDLKVQDALWRACSDPNADNFQELLVNFSETERSVLCLLALGLAVSEISCYKGISEVRIRQLISVVRYNKCWEETYGTEETINRRREVRAQRRRD